jgi:hypothetical protein
MINKGKIKEAVFADLQIKEIIRDSSFDDTLCEAEETAWTEFTALTTKKLLVDVFKNSSMLTTMGYKSH